MKKIKKNQRMHNWLHVSAAILAQWQHPVFSTKALYLFYWAMCTVMYRRTTAAIKMASKVGPFLLLLFHLLLPWRPLGQYGASSHPMVASSGFWSSPGHAALGNAICIALAHCHGHQNGKQWRCICLLSSLFFLTLLIAKGHIMVD
jgi:hypothetical protein